MTKSRNVFTAMILGIAFAFSACAGFEGRLASPAAGFPDIHDLILAHENYRVHFIGRSAHMPTALAFDPKWDELELTFHEHWVPVTDPRLMKEVAGWMALSQHHRPALREIIGRKDGRLYGYLYSVDALVSITSPAPGTLRLGNMVRTERGSTAK